MHRLEDNTIASIADSLVFYQSLQELDLSGNNLTTLGEQQLSLQQQLHQLQLADNQLSELRRGALEGLGRLERLDLSANCSGLSQEDFECSTSVVTVLETLQNMTSLLQRVETFNVSGNPLGV
ncbi:Platelet glycoprotein Ib alpha chain [Amphibalanus amphitrite]|uniref:Platelet glycoprotein Ib alpha chain n=1 Tax=Amphibalanus amphitrite TaxID=1232801 RepID=A0A6A4WE29_AMPAM|nr:Platelet glycoprotein Ib alpha chain [Amphibalanus amphitrite]